MLLKLKNLTSYLGPETVVKDKRHVLITLYLDSIAQKSFLVQIIIIILLFINFISLLLVADY